MRDGSRAWSYTSCLDHPSSAAARIVIAAKCWTQQELLLAVRIIMSRILTQP
ncbi:hypothetical protein [Streptomyces sp. NPDC058739]|uniref:hypothetical protein n=1 Tax=Streptomyces sp. NPDC058739 TaxID=3346618 RepID=UPI0036BAF479